MSALITLIGNPSVQADLEWNSMQMLSSSYVIGSLGKGDVKQITSWINEKRVFYRGIDQYSITEILLAHAEDWKIDVGGGVLRRRQIDALFKFACEFARYSATRDEFVATCKSLIPKGVQIAVGKKLGHPRLAYQE